MNRKLTRLAERRERLVAQAAAQRAALARDLEPWRARLALVDRGIAALRYVRRHPALAVGAAFIIAVWLPKGTGKWAGRAWAAWQFWRGMLRG